jgi:hypothetical protein
LQTNSKRHGKKEKANHEACLLMFPPNDRKRIPFQNGIALQHGLWTKTVYTSHPFLPTALAPNKEFHRTLSEDTMDQHGVRFD